ncbi:MAG: tripartite tricarboxylate transporter TctB family protein [Micrococcaceae bacterium]
MNSVTENDSEDATSVVEEEPVDFRHRLRFGLIALLGFGFFGWHTLKMPIGETTDPGPGLFPMIIILVGLLGSGLVAAEAAIKLRRNDASWREPKTERKAWLFVAALIGFALLVPYLGLYLSSTAFSIVTIRIISGRTWTHALWRGAMMGIIFTLVALNVLNLRLPAWPEF